MLETCFVLLGLLRTPVALSAEVKVLTAGAFKPVVAALEPAYKERTESSVVVVNDTVGALLQPVEAGETFDVAVLTPEVFVWSGWCPRAAQYLRPARPLHKEPGRHLALDGDAPVIDDLPERVRVGGPHGRPLPAGRVRPPGRPAASGTFRLRGKWEMSNGYAFLHLT